MRPNVVAAAGARGEGRVTSHARRRAERGRPALAAAAALLLMLGHVGALAGGVVIPVSTVAASLARLSRPSGDTERVALSRGEQTVSGDVTRVRVRDRVSATCEQTAEDKRHPAPASEDQQSGAPTGPRAPASAASASASRESQPSGRRATARASGAPSRTGAGAARAKPASRGGSAWPSRSQLGDDSAGSAVGAPSLSRSTRAARLAESTRLDDSIRHRNSTSKEQASSSANLIAKQTSEQASKQASKRATREPPPELTQAWTPAGPARGQHEQLIELLARLYAHTHDARAKLGLLLRSQPGALASDQLRAAVMATLGLDEQSMIRWLREKQQQYDSLRNATIEMIDHKPNKTIQICHDGPKILFLRNLTQFSDIYYCYTEQQWVARLWFDLRLLPAHYPIILLNMLIFLVGTTGNVFVCLSVYRNHQLRNVTNYFIVNLAFADLLVIIICLPATVIWDATLTWFFGTLSCKLIMFLQDVSISVSVLTLTAIAIDRYYAICYPLRFKSNLSQAKRVIAVIWLLSIALMSPDLIYLRAHESAELREAGLDTVLYSDCNYDWTERSSRLFQFVKTVLLYLLPFVFMFCAHYRIMKTLELASKGISEFARQNGSLAELTLAGGAAAEAAKASHQQQRDERTPSQQASDELRSKRHSLLRRLSSRPRRSSSRATSTRESQSIEMTSFGPADTTSNVSSTTASTVNANNNSATTKGDSNSHRIIEVDASSDLSQDEASSSVASSSTAKRAKQAAPGDPVKAPASDPKQARAEAAPSARSQPMMTMHNRGQLESRDKAAKMLMAIAIIFGICYFPVHCINFLRQFIHDIPQNDVTSLISMLSHSICYLNSAINPIIYNHMNSVFRAEFKRTLSYLIRMRKPSDEQPRKGARHHPAPASTSMVLVVAAPT